MRRGAKLNSSADSLKKFEVRSGSHGATAQTRLKDRPPADDSEQEHPTSRTTSDCWQARYQYDFAAVGIPRLSALYRYIDGNHVQFPAAGGTNDETEQSWELAYVIQLGAAKGLGLRYRQRRYTSNYFRDADEQRVNIDYTFALF